MMNNLPDPIPHDTDSPEPYYTCSVCGSDVWFDLPDGTWRCYPANHVHNAPADSDWPDPDTFVN